jgi:hypothetical protein|tara:strand:+ start:3670 stop:4992 length:1323 start_codon:yes stop_codon:yes gene_type:complete
MATYVNDLRLTELATGEGSGTWGTTTNVNLELIGESLSYGTEAAFGSDANATTTVADGSTDPARSFYYKVTSGATLSTTRVLTIAPNTVSRVMIIENATTGSQVITIKQGDGATVNIPNGGVKIVYLDGAGSGGAVVEATVDLDLTGTTTVAALTASGVITGSTVEATGDTAADDNAAMGYTAAEGAILTGQGATSDVTLKNDADGAVLTIPTGTTNVDIVGDVTAATVNADGDTAADDNAAMGYTAAEGLILTGQGATNDVTIKNDADGDVIAIPTGGTDANFHGNVNILAQGDLRLQDSSGGQYIALQAPATVASNVTLTFPADDGDADQVLSTNGSGVLDWVTSGGAYTAWAIKTTNYTASSGDQLVCNHASTAFTITLPAGSANDTVIISNAGAALVTVGRNGSQKINSVAADGTVPQGNSVQLVYVDDTIGWFEI